MFDPSGVFWNALGLLYNHTMEVYRDIVASELLDTA